MYLPLIILFNLQNKNGAYEFCCFKCKEAKAFYVISHRHSPPPQTLQ